MYPPTFSNEGKEIVFAAVKWIERPIEPSPPPADFNFGSDMVSRGRS
jgi:hypothetical protein